MRDLHILRPMLMNKQFRNAICLSAYVYVLCMYVCMYALMPRKHMNGWTDFIRIQRLRVFHSGMGRYSVNLIL
jgi:hypothetical protein